MWARVMGVVGGGVVGAVEVEVGGWCMARQVVMGALGGKTRVSMPKGMEVKVEVKAGSVVADAPPPPPPPDPRADPA